LPRLNPANATAIANLTSLQIAKATEEIGRRVEAIQQDTRSAVESISGISGVIDKINDYQTTIASAVAADQLRNAIATFRY
jgi:methyl-accepting chemotaxis protein